MMGERKRSIALLFLLCAAPVAASEAPVRPDISLANVRWQLLPGGVEKAFVGPDGRTWYRYSTSPLPASETWPTTTVASVKRQIEQEYRKAAPQLVDIEPALFEPGGRVWFSLSSVGHLLLLGYDGKQWTEYTVLDSSRSISGRCPTRGGLLEGRANRFAGGTAWFITHCGVLRFDGKQWQYQKFVDKDAWRARCGTTSAHDVVWLAVAPDGQAAVAYAAPTKEFFVFKQGKWSPCKASDQTDATWDMSLIPDGRQNAREEKTRGLVLPDSQMGWYLTDSGVLRRIPLATVDTAASPAKELPDVLKDGVPVTREDLSRLTECQQVYEDGNGRVFVIAARINGQQDGVAILQREGKVATLLGANVASGWQMSDGDDIPPILAQSGDQVWLANHQTASPPQLLDLKKGEIIDSVPNPEFSRLRAVSGDGRVFVSLASPPSIHGIRPLAVYTRGASNSGSSLKVSRIAMALPRYAITDRGMIWAHTPEGLVRFNGQQWNTVGVTKGECGQFLLPGRGDTMLVWGQRTATFYDGPQEVASGEWFDLFQQQRNLTKKAFGPGVSPGLASDAGAPRCGVRADRAGNIWCLEPSGRLLVESHGVWLDTAEALTSAGARAGHVANLAMIGDGSRLYIGGQNMLTRRGDALFRRIERR